MCFSVLWVFGPPLGVFGVGQGASFATIWISVSEIPILLPFSTEILLRRKNASGSPFEGSETGVGHPIQPLPDVRRAETASRGTKRPDGVACIFQVSRHKVEPSKSASARNLLAKDHVRSALADEPVHLRPKVAVV